MARTKKEDTLSLENILWNCRVALRGIGSTEKNRDAVISLVFLKFAGNKFETRRAEIIAEYGDIPHFLNKVSFYTAKNVFYLKETARWSYIVSNAAAEFIQTKKDTEIRFMNLSKKLKAAYLIVYPSGELSETETIQAQFFLAIRSIIFKQTKGSAPDAEIMNRVVEKMVEEALKCTGIENIVNNEKSVDLFSEGFLRELDAFKMPVTKFNALLKLMKKNIAAYGRSNKVKSIKFDKRLKKIVDNYNSRDKLVFVNEVVGDFVDQLSEKLIQLLRDLEDDKKSFERLGVTYAEKVFFDILATVRNDHAFPYAEEKCLVLAKEIKRLVDDKSKFADWANRTDIKAQLESVLTVLLYKNGYPPEWNDEVFTKIMEQIKNF